MTVINIFADGMRHPRPATKLEISFRNLPNQGAISIGEHVVTLTDTQGVDVILNPTDAKGKPARLDGQPVWSSSDPAVVSVTPSPDGLTGRCLAGDPGTATITAQADADLGEGTRSIAAQVDFTILAGEAVTMAVTVGTPFEQDNPPTPAQ